MDLSICKLRDLNIVCNAGTLVDYTYPVDQCSVIIQKLLKTLQKYTINEYLNTPSDLPYPDCIVRQIIRKHRDAFSAIKSS